MMRRMILCLSSIVLGGSGLLITAGEASGEDPGTGDRALVVKFFKEVVIGKTLVTPKMTFKWDDNKAEGELEDQFVYHNFAETAHGFRFDVTTVTKATIYDLDKEGRRIEPGRPWSGTVVACYEIGERASTNKLTGYTRVLSTTIKESRPTGTVRLVTGMKVADGKLTWDEARAGYVDSPSAGGKYKPVSSDVKVTLSLEDGKLRAESEVAYFDVDPDTLRRTPSQTKLPPLVSKEIADR